jgi:hypothetical protein
MTCVTSYKKKKKKTLHFETNDEHQARSYQNSLHCIALLYNVIGKLNQIKLVGKTNDKYVITFGIARTERSLSIDDCSIFDFFFVFWVDKCTLVIHCSF